MAVNRSRRARAARKRTRRMARVQHDLSNEQWLALQAAWGGCAYCGRTGGAVQRDCVLALSRGGRYTLDNIVPACRSCNASKCNDEVTTWMRRKRLDERAFLLRHLEVRQTLSSTLSPAWYEGEMTNEQDAHLEPVVIAAFGSVGEAEIAQAKLRSFGIESAIVDNDGGGVIPVDGDGVVEVEVRAADADAAAQVLAEPAT